MITFLLLLALSPCINAEVSHDAPRVSTEYGDVIGFSHKDAQVFLSIPYAAPPVGDLRFKKPVPPHSWSTPLRADKFGFACVPHSKDAIIAKYPISEDCLTLSVIAPAKKEEKGYPVLFYVHGGGFEVGNAPIYGYEEFADIYASQGIVVVSIQYRVGIMGFASLGDHSSIKGNYGLFDQAAALHFVERNIEKFGGDPKRITVFGISAGAASAGMLTLSPLTRDSIAGSIEMSGSPHAGWAAHNRVEKHTKDLADAVGCGGQRSIDETTECLRKLTVEQLHDGVDQIESSDFSFNMLKFAPRIDGEFAPKEYDLLEAESPKKPVLLGVHTHESIFFTQWNRAPSIHRIHLNEGAQQYFGRKVFEKYVRVLSREWFDDDEVESVVRDIMTFYVGPPQGEELTRQPDYDKLEREAPFHLERYSHLWSDLYFTIAARYRAEAKRKYGSSVFLYLFEHYSQELFTKEDKVKGSYHVNELPYLLGQQLKPFNWTDSEKKVAAQFREMMITFTKTGKPTVSDVAWPDFSAEDFKKHDRTPHAVVSSPRWKIMDGFYNKVEEFWSEAMSRYSFDLVRMRRNENQPQLQIPAPPVEEVHEEL